MNHDEMRQMKTVEHPCYEALRPGDVLRQAFELHLTVGKVTRVQKGDGFNLFVLRFDRATWVTFGSVRSDLQVDIDDVIVIRAT